MQDCKCPIDLLAEYDTREFMRQRHRPEREQQVGAFSGVFRPAIRGSDSKNNGLLALIPLPAQPLRKLL